MTYDEVFSQVVDLLQREQRVAYRVLKRRFDIDDDYVEDLKADLIDAKHVAADEDGKVLMWVGQDSLASSVRGERASFEQSDPRLSDSRLTAGERRQLTVLFCDMVGFTELANRVDPEVLQGLFAVTRMPARCASPATRATYSSAWAMALSPSLATHWPTRAKPNGPFTRDSRLSNPYPTLWCQRLGSSMSVSALRRG
jgi:hypothetical protein